MSEMKMNKIFRKIRDFIIALRLKKYSHVKTRLDEKIKDDFNFQLWLKQAMAYAILEIGKAQFNSIRYIPATTKEEKIKKKKALAETMINTTLAITKVYANNEL